MLYSTTPSHIPLFTRATPKAEVRSPMRAHTTHEPIYALGRASDDARYSRGQARGTSRLNKRASPLHHACPAI